MDQASNRLGLALILISLPVMFGLLGAGFFLGQSLCPPGTLLEGTLDSGARSAFGALIAGTGFLLAGIGNGGTLNPDMFRDVRKAARRTAIVGLAIILPGLGLWWDGIRTHYCATPQGIVVHPDPLTSKVPYSWSPISYAWTDTRSLWTRCYYGKAGLTVDVLLTMKDGRELEFGSDSWHQLRRNYAAVSRLLSLAAYRYDNRGSENCPPILKRLFSHRPG